MPQRRALTLRTAEMAAAMGGDSCSPSRMIRTLCRRVSTPVMGMRATGAPAGDDDPGELQIVSELDENAFQRAAVGAGPIEVER